MGALSDFTYFPLRKRVLALAAQNGRLTQQWKMFDKSWLSETLCVRTYTKTVVMLGDVVGIDGVNDEPAIGKIKKYITIYTK